VLKTHICVIHPQCVNNARTENDLLITKRQGTAEIREWFLTSMNGTASRSH